MRRLAGILKQLLGRRHSSGIAALEFAMLSPIFVLILAGTVDLGGLVTTKFRLDTAVAAASNYALLNGAMVLSSTGQSTLATSLATIATTSDTATTANGTVVVNNGPTVTVSGGTQNSPTGSATNTVCYCPTGTPTSLTWGSVVTCGTACTGGGVAGKFVLITATYTYNAIFSSYSFTNGGVVTSGSLVQTGIN